jgi:putative hydrolase of the HAD superfamily
VPAIEFVVFDLDDTLCDYAAAKRRALELVGAELQSKGLDAERFMRNYAEVEPSLFLRFSRREISLEEYRDRRFGEPLGGDVDAALSARLNEIYMGCANGEVEVFDDVPETLAALREAHVACAILTNGPGDGQRRKIAHCGLDRWIPRLFCSSEIGAAKPDRRAFDAVLSACAVTPSRAIMVGDNLDEDILGAQAAGMQGILVDRSMRYREYTGAKVRSLAEVIDHLHR